MFQASMTLAKLGWSGFFQSQLDLDQFESSIPVRVLAMHRGAIDVLGAQGEQRVALSGNAREIDATVGDWLLLDAATGRPKRVLERRSLFQRRAAGTGRETQSIASNIDTVFIVSSCDRDFNIARLERYLALAQDSDVTPVIVLTKADVSAEPETYRRRAERLMPGLVVECLDARDPKACTVLAAWCGVGQTVALLGSSGVGKSTLTNTLLGGGSLRTDAVRADDDKGRHTTTGRILHHLPSGGWLLDSPGMRELQLVDVASGIDSVFDDILSLAENCRFRDCRHETEPGCAVRAAIEAGTFDESRLKRYRKLVREDRLNSETLAERRARDRALGKRYASAQSGKQQKRL